MYCCTPKVLYNHVYNHVVTRFTLKTREAKNESYRCFQTVWASDSVFLYIPLSSLCCYVGCCVAGCCWNRERRNTAHLPHSHPTNTPVQNTHTHKFSQNQCSVFPCNQHCQANLRIAWWQLNLQGSLTVNNTFNPLVVFGSNWPEKDFLFPENTS